MMKRKVIYISHARLSAKLARDYYYIDHLIAKGVAVEYWDVVSLVREEFVEPTAKSTDYLHTIRTYSELETMLRLPENRAAVYVMAVNYFGDSAKIFRLMNKHDCTMVKIEWCHVSVGRKQNWRKIASVFSNPSWVAKKVLSNIKAITYRKLKLVKPFDIAFAAGQELITKNLYANKVVPINAPDYDQYRKTESKIERFVDGRYAVFLDEFLPQHSDYQMYGLQPPSPTDYYASIDRFFHLLETNHGFKVIIAAHPKAHYSTNPFHSREIHYGRTNELVGNAEFVITHHSASIFYAVLYAKPIIFIYTDEMASLYKNTLLADAYSLAERLDAAIYNIDKITQGSQILIKNVNLIHYETYKYNFITTRESEHTTTQEIFWREINGLLSLNAKSV